MRDSCADALPAVIYRGRFAPSPTGDLHAGSLLAAFGSWLLARAAGGEWLLRIEDIDPPREVRGAVDRQVAALAAFGLQHDGAVMRQSTRDHAYQSALNHLLARGQAFACHCSRRDLADAGGIHRRCVSRPPRQHPAIRLRVPDGLRCGFEDAVQGPQIQDVSVQTGDFVLRRADGYWAYQLAVVVDDAAQGINQVVRGLDLLDSTGRQIALQRALGFATPRYAHLPVVVGADGRKLSKSDAAHPVDPAVPLPALKAAWRALGQDPETLMASKDVATLLDNAQATFDASRIPRGGALSPQRTTDIS